MWEPKETLFEARDPMRALSLLTRLPVAGDGTRRAAATWAFPLAGAVVALLAGLVGWLADAFGLPAGLVAGLILVALVVMTGAMHEDGLADCADGFWGGWEPARRLEIMRDSRIGTYGVAALVLGLGLRWVALAALVGDGHLFAPLLAAAALSRAPLPVLMARMRNARGEGLSADQGVPGGNVVLLGCGVALVIAWLSVGFAAMLLAALAVALVTLVLAAVAQRKIGGQTGDVLGASQQLAEIAVLAVLAAAI